MTWPQAFAHAGPWIAFWLAMASPWVKIERCCKHDEEEE